VRVECGGVVGTFFWFWFLSKSGQRKASSDLSRFARRRLIFLRACPVYISSFSPTFTLHSLLHISHTQTASFPLRICEVGTEKGHRSYYADDPTLSKGALPSYTQTPSYLHLTYFQTPSFPHTTTQLSVDTVAGGRYHASDVDEDDDHPWKLKSKEAMAFTMEEVLAYDAHMFNVQGKLTKTMHVHQLAALQVRIL